MRRAPAATLLLGLALSLPSLQPAWSAPFVDATGRSVDVPVHPGRILPAGPPAAVLLLALAPDLMLGWPHPPSAEAAGLLPDEASGLPKVPHLTGRDDAVAAVADLHPDLILDYGDVSPRYADLAASTQARTHVPTILLDGALARTPAALRALGTILDRAPRAELLARLAEAILAAVPPPAVPPPRVVYGRGADGLDLVQPGRIAGEVFEVLGWHLVAPGPPPTQATPGQPASEGKPPHASIADVAALDPDLLILGSPAAARMVLAAADWQAVRAVREHHVLAAPTLPFGWVEEPPSINRLLGVAWLSGGDPVPASAMFGAVVYGRAPTAAQLNALRGSLAATPPVAVPAP